MTACPEIATDTEISQNNTNLAKTTKSLLSSGLQFVVAMVTGCAIPNMIRDVACFRAQSTAYQCKKNAAFPFSEQLTIVWLASLCIFTAGSVVAFRNVLQFPGYKAILFQLMFVPSLVTLVLLFTLALC